MEFRILGPVEVRGPVGPVRLGGSRQLSLMSALLLRANRMVSVDTLAEAVWDGDPPSGLVAAVHTYVSRLRKALEAAEPNAGERIATHPAGYRLWVEPGELDLEVFRTRVRRGRAAAAAGRFDVATHEFQAALALWRGPALAGLQSAYLQAQAAQLDEEQLVAVEDRIDVDLAVGKDTELISELHDLVTTHPLRERLPGQLMRALYRSGRQAEALQAYQRARQTLAEEVGVDPGPALQELHQRVLRGDRELLVLARQHAGRNDLPGDVADFIGRELETEKLLAAVPDADYGSAARTVVIEAIDGMAGVGKTALAVRVAHRLAERYPDGQLFVDLHGHTSGHAATDPMTALDTLLRALGVPGEQIPNDIAARAALWRAELANRRVLVVLDNAASAAQVRPLLPGTPGCLILVTSRRRLVDLEVTDVVSLDVLPAEDAKALFTDIVGEDRCTAEPGVLDETVRLCGYLPLAIRIAATRLRTRPAWSVGHLADRLRDDERRLAELAAGDRRVAVAFALSYHDLTPVQQRVFRLLGLHPGPDFDVHAAAALAGTDIGTTEQVLEELVDVHLLQQPVPGRYRFHDLLRDHARTTAQEVETDAEHETAVARLLDHYLHTAHGGAPLLEPRMMPIEVGQPAPGCVPRTLNDQKAALSWFDAEHACLLEVHRLAVERGLHAHVWQLAWALHSYHHRQGHIQDNLVTLRSGLDAARQLGKPYDHISAHLLVGHAYSAVGDHTESVRHNQEALALAEGGDDVFLQSCVHLSFSWAWVQQGEVDRALEHAEQALNRCERLEFPWWEAEAVVNVGWLHSRLGHDRQARTYSERALGLSRQHENIDCEANALSVLGEVAHHCEQYHEAVAYHREATAIRHSRGYTYEEANSLAFLGDAHHALGESDRAHRAWQHALDLYEDQRRGPDIERIRQRLASLGERNE